MSVDSIAVSCMGSRERYGLPIALHQAGVLQKLYTDIYVPAWLSKATNISSFPAH